MKIYVTAARHSPTGRVFSEVTKVEEVENHRLELVLVLSQTTSQHLSKLGAWYPHGRDGVATLAMHTNRFISIKTLGNGLCCLKIMVVEWKIDKKNWCTVCSAVTQQQQQQQQQPPPPPPPTRWCCSGRLSSSGPCTVVISIIASSVPLGCPSEVPYTH